MSARRRKLAEVGLVEPGPASVQLEQGRTDNLTIKHLPANERPRERLLNQGAGQLSTAELLAIVLRTGTTALTVTQMAEYLLKRFGGLEGLDRAAVTELCECPGLGMAKAAQLKSALELGRRLRRHQVQPGLQIRCPEDVFDALGLEMGALEHEQFLLVLLDTKNKIVAIRTLYEGSLNSTNIRVGEVFREAVRHNCAALIVAHNHPSGDPTPSPEDVRVTEELVKAGKLLDITVLDHVVVAGGSFKSLKKLGLGFQ